MIIRFVFWIGKMELIGFSILCDPVGSRVCNDFAFLYHLGSLPGRFVIRSVEAILEISNRLSKVVDGACKHEINLGDFPGLKRGGSLFTKSSHLTGSGILLGIIVS